MKLPETNTGFLLLPCRWVVERSFANASRFRRFARFRVLGSNSDRTAIRVFRHSDAYEGRSLAQTYLTLSKKM